MELIGKTTINPVLFYSGKFAGYFTWIVLFLYSLDISIVSAFPTIYTLYISKLILFIGCIFIIFSLINLGNSTRLGLPFEDTVLQTTGMYKISRNPMYLGFNLLTIASVIYTLNFLIIVCGVYSIIIYHLIILGEEKFLIERFGLKYSAYKEKVRRYL